MASLSLVHLFFIERDDYRQAVRNDFNPYRGEADMFPISLNRDSSAAAYFDEAGGGVTGKFFETVLPFEQQTADQ